MTRISALKPVFVDAIPADLVDGNLYISRKYSTVLHRCCCGCGSEVVTPLGPTEWRIIEQGPLVSLHPSVGSWNLPCRSHYWIRNNQVLWAEAWSDAQIAAVRARESAIKQQYYNPPPVSQAPQSVAGQGLWARFIRWLFG